MINVPVLVGIVVGCGVFGMLAAEDSVQDESNSSNSIVVPAVEAYVLRGVRLFVDAIENDELLDIAMSNPVPSAMQGMAFDGAFWLDADKNIASIFASPYQRSTPKGWSFFHDQTLKFPRNSRLVGAGDTFLWQGSGGTFVAVRDVNESDKAHLSFVSLLREIVGFSLEPVETFDQITTLMRGGEIIDEECANERFERVRSFQTTGSDQANTLLWYSKRADPPSDERILQWVFAIKEPKNGRTWLSVMEARRIDASGFLLPKEKKGIPEVYHGKIEHFHLIRFLNAEEEKAHIDRGSISIDDTARIPDAGPGGFRLAFVSIVTISLLVWFRHHSRN